MHCYYLKIDDDALLRNRSKRPAFVLRPLKSMLNFEVDILSLQQLDYEMDRTGYPVVTKNLKYDIVVTITYLTHILNSSKPLI